MTLHSAPDYATTSTTGSATAAEVDFTVKASRNIRIESDVVTGSGKTTHVVWTQSLSYTNSLTYRQNASVQVILARRGGLFLANATTP